MKQFDLFNNRMFFNILNYDPDISVLDFINKYFPIFSERQQPTWEIHPPDTTLPVPYRSEHNLIFDKHPFWDISFKEGRLELSAIEAEGFLPRLQKPRVSFSFATKEDADTVLDYFRMRYENIGCEVKVSIKENIKITVISDAESNQDNSVAFALYKNILYNQYDLLFSYEAIINGIIF